MERCATCGKSFPAGNFCGYCTGYYSLKGVAIKGSDAAPVVDLEKLIRPPMAVVPGGRPFTPGTLTWVPTMTAMQVTVSAVMSGLRERGWPEPLVTDNAVIWGALDAGHVALSNARIYYNGAADQAEHGEIDISDPSGENAGRYIEAIDRLRWVIGLPDMAEGRWRHVTKIVCSDPNQNDPAPDVFKMIAASNQADHTGHADTLRRRSAIVDWCKESDRSRRAMIRAAGEDPDGPLVALKPSKPLPREERPYVPTRWIGE